MSIFARFRPYTLHFKMAAGTSRGVLHEKPGFFLVLQDHGCTGIGECPILPGLSIDPLTGFEDKLHEVCNHLNKGAASKDIDLADFPSIEFGLETALLDLENHGKRKIFPGTFYEGKEGIPINGLVWMGDRPFMEKQLGEKIAAGFRCIKLKIGSLDFETELAILADIRKNKTPQELEIRLDANGAFSNDEAMEKLEKLAVFGIHSIEQPIKQGQWTRMAALCENSPIPIALDEELIGIRNPVDKAEMIKTIRPAYIILKPGLLGGFSKAQAWINAAGEQQVNWWVTSALESNIGLNAIAQWTSSLKPTMPQGLGTGQLFENNIASPLVIEDAMLWYRQPGDWDLTPILE